MRGILTHMAVFFFFQEERVCSQTWFGEVRVDGIIKVAGETEGGGKVEKILQGGRPVVLNCELGVGFQPNRGGSENCKRSSTFGLRVKI